MDDLRKAVKVFKATENISYRELAEHLEINQRSFYNWLGGAYELGEEKARRLYEIMELLKGA